MAGKPGTMTDEVARADPSAAGPPVTPALAPETPLETETPGRYQLGAELARGGQSVVYVAYDVHLGREVAFKTLRPDGSAATGASLSTRAARFVREARVTAQLEHPGIAPVHEVGRRADGSFYATQKLVRGKTLEALLQACASPDERLRLLPAFLGICQAVAYAHQRGVIHRDLKPGNLMVGALGEAVVIDWGLARTHGLDEAAPAAPPVESLLDGAARTRDGAILGTPAYMSPEQAVGAAGQVDERSDVWSLGVILYEVLTGRRPFLGDATAEVLREVATATPPPVLTLSPRAPPELAAVVERALQRDPRRRYPSARELAAEVGRWLAGDRVVAYEYRSWELVRRFVQRNVASTVLAALVVAALAAAGLVTRARYLESRQLLAESLLEHAREAADGLRWDDAAAWFASARVQEDSLRARLGLAHARSRAPLPLATHEFARASVDRFCGLGDGGTVATTARGADVRVLEADTGAVLTSIARSGVLATACAPEAGRMVTVQAEGPGSYLVEQWSLPAGEAVPGAWRLQGPADLWDVQVSGDGTLLAAFGSTEGAFAVQAHELQGGRWLASTEASPTAVALAGRHLLAWIDSTHHLMTLNLDGGVPVRGREVAARATAALPIEAGGMLVGTTTGVLEFLPGDPAVPVLSVRGTSGQGITNLARSDPGPWLASSESQRGAVTLWDVSGGIPSASAVLANFGSAGGQALPLALSPGGSRLFAAVNHAARSTLTVWRTPDALGRRLSATLTGVAALSSDGRRLAFIEREGRRLRVVEPETGRALGGFPVTTEYSRRQVLSFSATSGRLAVLQRSEAEVHELDGAGGTRRLGAVPAIAPPLALSPDGTRLLTTTWTGNGDLNPRLRLWSVDRLESLWTADLPAEGLAFSPDGSRIAVGGESWVALLDARTGWELHRWVVDTDGELYGLAFSADGRTLAVGGQGGVWRLEVESGRLTRLGAECSGWSVAISADGQWIAASSTRVSLWHGDSTTPVLEFPEEGYPNFVGLSPDGRMLYHAGTSVKRLELPLAPPSTSPEDELAEVLHTYRLAFDGQKVVPAEAGAPH